MSDKRSAKGAGSFHTNSDGAVTHRKSVGYKANGNRKILTVTAATKAACIREMKKKEAEWDQKKSALHIQAKDTVSELCYHHLNYQVENDELKHKSIDRRECTIANQLEKYNLGNMQIHTVSSGDIENHIQLLIKEGKVSESSIIKVLDVLNAAYTWAVLQGDLESNPVEAVKNKMVKKLKKLSVKKADDADVTVFSEEEERQFIEEAMREDKNGELLYPAGAYLLLLLYTGMRCGEMIVLTWKEVDWENGTLTIQKSASMVKNREKTHENENNFVMHEGSTKNQKARVIQLSADAIQVLRRIYLTQSNPEADDLIVPTRSGKMNTASNLEHRMKVILKNVGLSNVKGGLHIFRKTFATRMYENGARVEEIAGYIGDLESTTRKYYIAIRKKLVTRDGVKQIVRLPSGMERISVEDKEIDSDAAE